MSPTGRMLLWCLCVVQIFEIALAKTDEPTLLVCPMAGRFASGHRTADSISLQEGLLLDLR